LFTTDEILTHLLEYYMIASNNQKITKWKGFYMSYKQIVLSLLFISISEYSIAELNCTDSPGALVLAHGSHGHGPHNFKASKKNDLPIPHDHWNETVTAAVNEVKKITDFPVELAFGMWDKKSFDEGVQKLSSQGVCELRVIPLFVSSDSEMVDIQKYMFGITDRIDFPIKVGKVNIPKQIKVVKFKNALDTHEFVSEILTERVREISLAPESESIILVAHGPYGDLYEPRWIDLLKTHGTRIQESFLNLSDSSFHDFSYFTLRDDSPALIRDERTRLIRQKVESLNQQNITPIIIPVLLSSGGIEKGIFERLDGLEYKIQNKFLMPHQRMVDWISYSANNHN
jgi:hypothetical protein